MSIKVFLAILLGKAVKLFSKLVHKGGTAMPGRFALKICPNLLEILGRQVKCICVTGTNGKTTTCRIIEEEMRLAGLNYFANKSGANLQIGIVTDFIVNCSLGGKMRKDCAVLECDEAAAVRIFKELQPEIIVLTNLFDDQVDRYGGVLGTLDYIKKAVAGTPSSVLCLNGDCPLCSSVALNVPNKVLFFGIEQTASDCNDKVPESAYSCPVCGEKIVYDYLVFDSLGGFRCPECGWGRGEIDVAAEKITDSSSGHTGLICRINGSSYEMRVNLPAMYNVYNALAAAAAGTAWGISIDVCLEAAAGFKCGFGRMEKLNLGKKGASMTLVKNTAGCNQVIRYLQTVEDRFVLSLCINNRVSDGKDISWLQTADFEALAEMGDKISKIYVSGERMEELYARLVSAGIDESRMEKAPDYNKLLSELEDSNDPVYIVPNYTAMMDFRPVIVSKCGGAEFWE